MNELVRLPGGGRFVVRPLDVDDAALVRAGFESLSPDSLRTRFFSPVPRLTAALVADLTAVDPGRRIVLLAVDVRTCAFAGEVRAVRWRNDPAVADVAVTVAEAYRGRGLSTALLRRIRRVALAEGVEGLRGHVLVDNAPARAMLRRAGATTSFDEPGVLRFDLALVAPTPALPALTS